MYIPTNDIIERVIAEQGTKEEAKAVARWFATPDGQARLSKMITADMKRIEQIDGELIVDHSIPSDEMYAQIEREIRRRRIRRRMLFAAAVLLPCLILAGIGMRLNRTVDLFAAADYQEVYVPKGERMQMMFQDGTKVCLNSDTRIKYPAKFSLNHRQVWLEGEAYFVVTPNKSRRFEVALNDGVSVDVLGTSFNVKAYPTSNEITISLDEGKVAFEGAPKDYTLKPQEVLVYDKKTHTGKIYGSVNTLTNSLWRQNIIVFKDALFSEVTATLSRLYNVEFKVNTARAYDYSFTMTCDNLPLETVLSDMERIAPIVFDNLEGVVQVNAK